MKEEKRLQLQRIERNLGKFSIQVDRVIIRMARMEDALRDIALGKVRYKKGSDEAFVVALQKRAMRELPKDRRK